MNIVLNKSVRDWIDAEVRSGRYASEVEAIEHAVQETIERDEVERLREKIRESERQIERGEVVLADDAHYGVSAMTFISELQARIAAKLPTFPESGPEIGSYRYSVFGTMLRPTRSIIRQGPSKSC